MITGVVVGHTDLGEADRIIRVLTPDLGRTAVIARGARRSKKRFAGMLEVGNRVRLQLHRGRGGLPRITEVELVDGVRRAREDLDRLTLLAYGCEITSRLAGEDMPAPKLARLLVVWVERLEHEAPVGVASRQALEVKALKFAGLLPDLTRCARCDRPLAGPCCFPHDGGVLHASCGPGPEVSAEAVAALDRLLRTPLFEVTPELRSAAGWLLLDRIEASIRSGVKSGPLLRELLQG